MNFKTYSIGTEQEFKNIKMRVNYPDTDCPKVVGCITDQHSNPLVYVTVDNVTPIQPSPCIVEGILEICSVPCESNNEAQLSQRLAAINNLISYFKNHTNHIDMIASTCQSLKLSDTFYLWIYPTYASSFHLYVKKKDDNINSCANQLTIGMSLEHLMQFLGYEGHISKAKDFSSDLIWFKKWEQNPFTSSQLRFAYDYILSIFVKAHKINQLRKISPTYQPGDLNHAEIKNDWQVLPRTPLYHIFDLFTDSDQQSLETKLKEQKSIYGDEIDRYWSFYKDKDHKDDLILRSGLLETKDLINGQETFLFEYRSVKVKVSDIYEDDKKIIWKGK